MPVHNFRRPQGRLVEIEIESAALVGNLLGDPTRRVVAVYLPPGYDADASRRYPLFVDLVGFTGSGLAHLNWRAFGESVPQRLDRLVEEGRMGPVVAAFPDCFTSLGGNQWAETADSGAPMAGSPGAGSLGVIQSGALEQSNVDLTAELVKQTEDAKSPLLAFRYTSTSKRLPVLVVNTWGELFLKRHQGLSSNVTEDFYQRVQAQFQVARDSLEAHERRLTDLRAGYQVLKAARNEMDLKNTKLDSALQAYQQVQAQIQDKQRQLAHTDALLRGLEHEGRWVGYLSRQEVLALAPVADAPPMRADLVRLVRQIAQLELDSARVVQDTLLPPLLDAARQITRTAGPRCLRRYLLSPAGACQPGDCPRPRRFRATRQACSRRCASVQTARRTWTRSSRQS